MEQLKKLQIKLTNTKMIDSSQVLKRGANFEDIIQMNESNSNDTKINNENSYSNRNKAKRIKIDVDDSLVFSKSSSKLSIQQENKVNTETNKIAGNKNAIFSYFIKKP